MKKLLAYSFAFLSIGGLLAAAAIVHGMLANRWDAPSENEATVALVKELPREFGEWQLLEEQPLSDIATKILQCTGYTNRVYSNRRTGDQIAVTLLLGPSGPLTVHTPEVCLASRDFEAIGNPDRVSIPTDDGNCRFYYSMFRSTNPVAPAIEVFYGWNHTEGWEAPDAPRFAYGGVPYLFKLQVVSQLWPNVGSGESGLGAKFLSELVRAMPRELSGRGTPSTPQDGRSS